MMTRQHLMIRGMALMVLLVAAYIAWTRNFGEGIKGVPALAVLSAALTFALEWIDRSQADRMKKWLTHSMLSLPFLVTGFLVMFVLLTLNAPVTVLSSSDQDLPVTLTALDVPKSQPLCAVSTKNEPARFHTWVTPLGRPFQLKVKGYTARTLDVAAPGGITISADRDLVPQLVVLIRPTPDGMFELHSGGSIVVYRKTSDKEGKEVEIANNQPGVASSILLGTVGVPLPHDLISDWRLELQGARMEDTARARILRAWKNPVLVQPVASAEELAPHQSLRVELRNKTGEAIQCGAMELPANSGNLVDLPLGPCQKTPAGAAPVNQEE